MTASSSSPSSAGRPRVVDVAFWICIAGAVVLIVGGLMAASATFDAARSAIPDDVGDDQVRTYLTIYRTTGIGAVLLGGASAYLAGQARRGDARFRRALVGLTWATVVVVVLLAIGIGVAQPLILLAQLPLLIGALLFVRPAASRWFHPEDRR
ncbi:hypothetical protein [Mycobacterium sp. SMC-4]|uniref:hypothetical protein n=1 Tax=Mycobacterium sp. SMC-4 TaxID=2857059 RepID=UPI0021B31250|nr:hypothetical protein [Mycobacterium sp. SMC-4]UXA18667.1 hypothetical protein KXD98_02860 [Mycobacterium sp. SMC-4]